MTHEEISVTIFKEGDRSVQVKIPVRFHAAYAQSAWLPFLNHVMHELKLEDIDGVYEDIDGAPVARIASLVDGGLYFARPTEVSAMLRSLVQTEKESYPAWPSIEEGLEAKRELERCREYYEHQLLPMSLGNAESKAAPTEAASDAGVEVGFVWAMKVKQGFKCRVYKTPECRGEEVLDTLPMGTTVSLSTDWGEVMEKHPTRGKDGKGKVLWMTSPQEGFVERRPLEDVKAEEGGPAAAALVAAAPAAPPALTAEDRIEIIRNATDVSEILRSTLRRGAYFEGAAGVHDDVRVHCAAMRAAATLMRKHPASRKALLECKGIELFVLLVTKFCEEDRLLCEFGCWAFSVFTGEGDSPCRDHLFQEALVQAGGLASIGSAVEAHRTSASLRRYCVGALVAAVHDNASTAGRLHHLGLHLTVAEDAIRRWPNDPELSCLSCWVLRSVVDPPISHTTQEGPGEGSSFVLEGGGAGSVVGSVLSYDSAPMEQGGRTRTDSVGAMVPPDTEASDRQAGGGGVAGGDGGSDIGSDSGSGEAAFDGSSTASGSVFGTRDNESSDLLISLADDDDGAAAVGQKATAATASADGKDAVSPSGSANGDKTTAATLTGSPVPAENATSSAHPTRGTMILPGSDRNSDIKQRLLDSRATAGSSGWMPGADVKGTDKPGELGVSGAAAVVEGFEGEQDGDELERLLKLAEATKVLNHDNEDTRKAASALVEALLRKIDSSYASGTRRRRKASRGRVDRILREGRAFGAL